MLGTLSVVPDISDRELEWLALAADPDPEIPADAVPFGVAESELDLLEAVVEVRAGHAGGVCGAVRPVDHVVPVHAAFAPDR